MKAVVVPKQGASAEVHSDIEIPEPNDDQILVKCIYTAVNPLDAMMASYGLLVETWPMVPGCDAAGIVVKAGKNAVNALGRQFQEGDEVFGCTRIAAKGHSAWQEYFLLDAIVTIPKPANIDFAQASTAGSSVFTAFLGVFDGLKVPLLDPQHLPEQSDEWALVFGGSSSVGKFAVQALKLAGYKVVSTGSTKSFDLLKSFGADATIDYNKSESEIIEEVKIITNGTLNRIFDAVSVNNAIATSIFTSIPSPGKRFYATTNDWDPRPDASLGFDTYGIALGAIGRPEAVELNKRIKEFIPVVYKLLESGKLKTSEYRVEGEGVEGILEAWEVQKSGKAGSTKVVAKVADV